MESRRYKKGSAINTVSNCEGGFVVFYGLEEGEVGSKKDCKR